ncbi:hypothetical protein Hdeb2414_s0083g00781821 [Helianthus debilis subsp. tardiflorus]
MVVSRRGVVVLVITGDGDEDNQQQARDCGWFGQLRSRFGSSFSVQWDLIMFRLQVNGFWLGSSQRVRIPGSGSTRSNQVNSVKLGQLSESTQST